VAYLTRATPRRRPPAMETDVGAGDGANGKKWRPSSLSLGRCAARLACARPPRHHHPAAEPLDGATRLGGRGRLHGRPGSPRSIRGGEGRSGARGLIRGGGVRSGGMAQWR
jgi:hypothetical protein